MKKMEKNEINLNQSQICYRKNFSPLHKLQNPLILFLLHSAQITVFFLIEKSIGFNHITVYSFTKQLEFNLKIRISCGFDKLKKN